MAYQTELPEKRIALSSRQDLAARIDETRLVFQPDENPEEVITRLCQNALKERFRSVCVRPQHVRLARSILQGSPVMVATVIAFPQGKRPLAQEQQHPTFGDAPWEEKVAEMRQAREDGADEFDIVMNVPRFKGLFAAPPQAPETVEFTRLVEHAGGVPIKLIIEADLLTDAEMVLATQLAAKARINFVKTATGMLDGGKGATLHNISLIYKTIQAFDGPFKPGIKASGGIRTARQACDLLQAGADVLGSSAGSALLDDFEAL